VARACPKARLIFLGTKHPNPNVPRHEIVDRLVQLAEETGEKDRSIFFIEWLSYQEREALLLEADLGITLHPIHAETRYSIRTRVLDYFWARLPICITEGDVTSEWVTAFQVGRTVPPGDADALAEILIEMLSQKKGAYDKGFDALHKQLSWANVVEPLRNYALGGNNAPDRDRFLRTMHMPPNLPAEVVQGTLKRAAYIWATKGSKAMLEQTIHHIIFMLGKR
jgi:glycosyltransferase involved in cell wall biosynthesis